MARIAFLAALLIAAIFFYFRDNTLWIFFALWFVWALLQQQIAAIAGVISRLSSVPAEIDANSVLSYARKRGVL